MKNYIAYGSNLNKAQMAHRCPDAEPICSGTLEGFKLVFRRGYLTVEECPGNSVPVGIWKISTKDEINLDRYEGWPKFYSKLRLPVTRQDGTKVSGLVYIMNDGFPVEAPSDFYFYTVYQGYDDFALLKGPLLEAYDAAKWPEDDTTVSTTNNGHG